MAITTLERTQIEKVFVAFLNAAPSITYLNQLVGYAGRVDVLAKDLSQTDAFKSIYPAALTNEEFAAKFVANFVGSTASTAAQTYVKDEVVKSLNAGISRGDTLFNVVVALQSVPDGDATFGTTKKAFENKVAVADYYAITKLATSTDLTTLQNVIAGVTATTDVSTTDALEKAVAGTVIGQTFTLTTGTDNLTGTTSDDTFNASTGLSADGTTAIATTNALDVVDGGAGVDTLNVENTQSKNTLTGTFKNIENLTFIGAGKINNDVDVASTDFSGTITFKQTDVWAAGQKVTGLKGQTVALNTVADATIATLAYDAAQTSATVANTAAKGDATFSISGGKLDTVNISTDKTVTAKTLTVTNSDNTVKTANITATGAAAVSVGSNVLETVKISGAGAVTLTAATAPSKALDASGSTGGVTYAVDLVAQQFTGGAGNDTVQFGATTKAQTLGAGNDKATISADLGTGGSIDAGDGTDTLSLTATLADTLDANTNFNAKVSNFEKLALTTVGSETLDLANLDGLNYVSVDSATALVLNNYASGGTLEITDAATQVTAVVKDSATNTADVFNVVASAAANKNVGTVVVANVETVNINADDTATAPDGSIKHTLVLTADKATKVVVTGDAQLDLTLTGSTKVASIDASANTAGITTNLTVASGITLTGTAKADTITLGNLSVVTGGAGKDAYTVSTPTNGNTYATITDLAVGETIQFTDKGAYAGSPLGAKLALAGTAAFADYLQAATAGTTAGEVKWFQYGGDTYVVNDGSATAAYVNGTDEIVKLTGILDLSKSTVDATGLLTVVAA